MEVRLKDLMCRSFRFLIEDKFRLELFRKAIEKEGMIKNLAKKLECDPDSIRLMKIGQTKFIKWQILKKLIAITEISEEELEKHVVAIKGGMSGKVTEVKLPIIESPELALLVAKGMGDGSIEKDTFRFSFWNNERKLVKEVCDCVNKAIGRTRGTIIKLKDGRIQVKFCPFVGFVLHRAGVPVGNKTLQCFDVPEWIKNGSKEIKLSFLRGIFDDEGCVKKKNKKSRSQAIIFAQGKLLELKGSLENFLCSIKEILSEFGIKSGKITKQEIFRDKRERNKIVLRFSVFGKKSLENFLNKIGFTHPKKSLLLQEAVKSFVDIHKNRKKILKMLLNKPSSVPELSRLTGLNQTLIWAHMRQLLKENIVSKDNSKKPTLWFLKNEKVFFEIETFLEESYF
ncbi:MAG: LAGLIDADG family homing endonuclease [Candidatus Aenigmatarchaeota archaeon]